MKASKGTQHWFVKQDECSLVSGEGSFPRPCLGMLKGVGAWSGSKEQTVAVGHGARPEILMFCLPARSTERWEAGRAQAGRQGSASGHIEGGFPFPEIFRGGSWLRFWMLNGKSVRLGFGSRRLRRRMETSAAALALHMRQEDVGLTGQRQSLDGGSLAGRIWSLGSS